jgi:hypothetical protein
MMKRLAILSLLLCSATADAKSVFHDAPPLAEPLELQQPLTVSEITSDTDLLLDPAGIIEIGKSIYAGGTESICIYFDSDNDSGICGAANQDERLEFWYGNNGLFYLVDLSGTPVLRQFSGSGPAIAWRDPDNGPVYLIDAQHGLNVSGIGGGGLGTDNDVHIYAGSATQMEIDSDEVVITPSHTKYAEAYLDAGSQAAGITTQNQWEEVIGCSAGDLNGFTHSACGFTTVDASADGKYLYTYNIAGAGGALKDYEFAVSIDNQHDSATVQSGCRSERTMGAAATTGSLGASCILTIAHTDVIELVIRNIDAVTADFIYSDITIVMHKL